MSLVAVSRDLSRAAGALRFGPPVAVVLNPHAYARAPHEAYLERYGRTPKEVLLLGMNPGPFGMAQTGVPFGDPVLVREWLGIEGPVEKPPAEHPRRRIEGFASRRREVSGTRLWSWARARFRTPDAFFARFFVWNLVPLGFLDAGGRNLTPDRLPAADREPLLALADAALERVVEALGPRLVVGMGAFAEARARAALGGRVRVGRIPHPSPASPAANRGWAAAAEAGLRALGVHLPG